MKNIEEYFIGKILHIIKREIESEREIRII